MQWSSCPRYTREAELLKHTSTVDAAPPSEPLRVQGSVKAATTVYRSGLLGGGSENSM